MAGTKFLASLGLFFRSATNMQNWAAYFGFCLATVTVSLKWTLVSLYPLGLETRGVGIHQRQPNYLPTYNGIFSIHALNFTPSTTATSAAGQQHQQSALYNASLTEDEDRIADQETNLFPEDGTAVNELDSEDRIKISEQTTFPQLHVVTQTIGDVKTGTAFENSHLTDEDTTTAQNETTSDLTHTDSETLLEGSDDDVDESEHDHHESEDLFDRLMRTIQGHWLDFVSKMKMSVLDVWKSISHHMMERLENFATDV